MIKEQGLQKFTKSIWFLDSYISCHLYNDQTLFSNLKAKSIDFVMAVKQVIQTEKIGMIFIPLVDDNNIKLHNVTLAPSCDLNLISLGQL